MQMTVGNTKCNTSTALKSRHTISRLLVFSCLAIEVLTLMHPGSFQPPAIYWEELDFCFVKLWDLPLLVLIVYTVNSGHCEWLKVSLFFPLLWKKCELLHPAKTTCEWNFTIFLNVCWTISCHDSECLTLLLPSVFIVKYDATWFALFLGSVGMGSCRCVSSQLLVHSRSTCCQGVSKSRKVLDAA